MAKKAGKEILLAEAEAQLDRLDEMGPLTPEEKGRLLHWLEESTRKLGACQMKTFMKGYRVKSEWARNYEEEEKQRLERVRVVKELEEEERKKKRRKERRSREKGAEVVRRGRKNR